VRVNKVVLAVQASKLRNCKERAFKGEGKANYRTVKTLRYSSTHSWYRYWMEVISFTPRALFQPGKESLVPVEYKHGWIPDPFWTRWRNKKEFPLPGIEPRSSNP